MKMKVKEDEKKIKLNVRNNKCVSCTNAVMCFNVGPHHKWAFFTIRFFFVLLNSYELSDGQIRSEEGRYKDGVDAEGNPVKILVVQGAFSWVAPG